MMGNSSHHPTLEVMEGEQNEQYENPTNIAVVQNRIMQVSIYNSFSKFGLHRVEYYGEIIISKGLNLSPAEFDCFLAVLKEVYGYGAKKVKHASSIGRGDTPLSFPVTMYTWKWNPVQRSNSVILPSVTTDLWYVSPQLCLAEAGLNKPAGDYDVDFK